MKVRKPVLRTCVVTKEVLEKKQLVRVVKNNANEVFVDLTGRLNGRGAYLKLDKEVILKAQKSKILDKNLEITIPENIYMELLKLVE